MKEEPNSVSVIIPAHNAAAYLRESVESALQAEVAEIIVVENGSTDATPALCRELAMLYPDIVKVFTLPEGDVSQARNHGTEMARSPYLMYLDADDLLPRGAVRALLTIAESDPEIDCVVGQMTHNKIDEIVEAPFVTVSPTEAIRRTLYQRAGWHPSASAKLYRRKVLGNNAFVPGHRYEDLQAFAPIMARCRKVASTKAVVYYYRPVTDSFMNRISTARFDALWAVDSLRHFAATQMPAVGKAAVVRSFSAYFDVFMLARRNGYTEIAEKCWQFLRQYRWEMLMDSKVRLKNKAGAVLSFLGSNITASFAKLSDKLKR